MQKSQRQTNNATTKRGKVKQIVNYIYICKRTSYGCLIKTNKEKALFSPKDSPLNLETILS